MGIDNVGPHTVGPGHVELNNPVRRNAFQERVWIVAVVGDTNIDVVDVEQKPAARAARELAEKFPFRHFGIIELHASGDIFEHDRAAEIILHQLHAADHVIERLAGIGDRQQIVQVLAMNSGPARMIRNPTRLYPFGKILERPRYSKFGGAVDAIESETPCITTG